MSNHINQLYKSGDDHCPLCFVTLVLYSLPRSLNLHPKLGDPSAMESKSTFTLLMVLCLLLMREPYDCSSVYRRLSVNAAGPKEMHSRKLLAALKDKKTASRARLQGLSSGSFSEKSVTFHELRKVPSGPDPLHNGGTPKKLRTP